MAEACLGLQTQSEQRRSELSTILYALWVRLSLSHRLTIQIVSCSKLAPGLVQGQGSAWGSLAEAAQILKMEPAQAQGGAPGPAQVKARRLAPAAARVLVASELKQLM